MTAKELEILAEALGPVVRAYVEERIAAHATPERARLTALEHRVLELEAQRAAEVVKP